LKNADDILDQVMKKVDVNKDGLIHYAEFRTFVRHAERELHELFRSIDRNHDGTIDKEELQDAFKRSGLAVPKARLDRFFDDVDKDHDGTISFDEWRSFLLFVPAHTLTLKTVLSYYSSTYLLGPEGDVHISDETLQGL
ncbi:hypothetical protein LTS18_014313, partial [Coniosporium uncinatum]